MPTRSGVKDSHQDVGGVGWVGERAENVEEGAHPQFAADRCHILHRGMMAGRKHEAQPDRVDAAGNLHGRELDLNAQRLENVGASRARRDTAVAVLGNFRTGGTHHEHRGRGNVEGMRAIASRTHHVHEVRATLHHHRRSKLAHDLCGCTDLADRFLFHPQSGEQRRSNRRGQVTTHDHAHQIEHFVMKDLPMLDAACERFLRRDRHERFLLQCAG